MTFLKVLRSKSSWLSFLLFLALINPSVFASLGSVSDVTMINYKYRNLLAASGSSPVLFPTDHSSANNISSAHAKWELEANDDGSLSFKNNGSYLRATSQTLSLVQISAPGNYEKFFPEKSANTYFILTYDGKYLRSEGAGQKSLSQGEMRSDASRWVLLQELNPYQDQSGIIIFHESSHVLALANRIYPYALSLDNDSGLLTSSWSNWDVTYQENGLITLYCTDKHLSVGLSGFDTYDGMDHGDNEEFTLVSENGANYLKTLSSQYIGKAEGGSEGLELFDDRVEDARWYFMGVVDLFTMFKLPSANAGAFQSSSTIESIAFDASASFAYNGKPLSYSWSVLTSPEGSSPILFDPQSVNAKLLPDMFGEYVLKLTVKDTRGRQAVTITRAFFLSMVAQNPDFPVDEIDEFVEWDFSFNTTPAVFANMQLSIDTDTANVRIKNVGPSDFTMYVEEETSLDLETMHFDEVVGYLAIPDGRLADMHGNIIGEVGRLNWKQVNNSTWGTLDNLLNEYKDPVVIMVQNTANGKHPSHVRLKNVTSASFNFKVEEWSYQDGYHTTETLVYLVVEAGVHPLANGQTLQATTASFNHQMSEMDFLSSYTEIPIVLSQSQTFFGTDPVVTRNRVVSSESCRIIVQEEERLGSHPNETVGVISIGN